MNILLTGASRGIGLEFVRQLSPKEHQILAACRHPEQARELQELAQASAGRVRVITADVEDERAPQLLAAEAEKMGSIDLLINNAGTYPEGESVADFEQGFRVNAIAPYLITQRLLPFLKKSKHPKALYLTSMMGSIADNTSGGSVAYRASKTALNMMVRCLTIDVPWLTTVLMHPGWVKTRIGGPNALISTAESVQGMLRVVDGLKLEDSGAYLDYEGDGLPW
jgi:NAD(P)-dependent dehydrogenase (short-subunit alcohol dehydrogenase family)